jgi:hypothetical protein
MSSSQQRVVIGAQAFSPSFPGGRKGVNLTEPGVGRGGQFEPVGRPDSNTVRLLIGRRRRLDRPHEVLITGLSPYGPVPL